jgi:hypothetical protein
MAFPYELLRLLRIDLIRIWQLFSFPRRGEPPMTDDDRHEATGTYVNSGLSIATTCKTFQAIHAKGTTGTAWSGRSSPLRSRAGRVRVSRVTPSMTIRRGGPQARAIEETHACVPVEPPTACAHKSMSASEGGAEIF